MAKDKAKPSQRAIKQKKLKKRLTRFHNKLNRCENLFDSILQKFDNGKAFDPYFENKRNRIATSTCNICDLNHSPKQLCTSKPKSSPNTTFPQCDICQGFHPQGHCFFEYLRRNLTKTSFCIRCQFTHSGFCDSAIRPNTNIKIEADSNTSTSTEQQNDENYFQRHY